MLNLIVVSQTVRAYVWWSARKTGASHPTFWRSLKVIKTDTDRSGTYLRLSSNVP